MPREPEDFVETAVRAGHPRFFEFKTFETAGAFLQANLVGSQSELAQRRGGMAEALD